MEAGRLKGGVGKVIELGISNLETQAGRGVGGTVGVRDHSLLEKHRSVASALASG